MTLLDMVRSMMSYASLLVFFWGYALETTQYILNLVPSKAVSEGIDTTEGANGEQDPCRM